MSFMGQSMPLDFGIGYYLVFLGFAVLIYAREAGERSVTGCTSDVSQMEPEAIRVID